jgi:hypothetical protein
MKYKLLFLFSFFLIAFNDAYSQAAENNQSHQKKIGITFSSFGANEMGAGDFIGDAEYKSDYFYTVGITFIYPLKSWLDVETGLEYSYQVFLIKSSLPNPPVGSRSAARESFSLLEIPLTVRFTFWHYLFFNPGLLVDIEPPQANPLSNLTGLGEMLGLGANIILKQEFHFF